MKKRILMYIQVVCWLMLPGLLFAAPAIFYSDLTSAPNSGGQDNKGAFVTIWGNNFGATRGTATVTIGGGQADNYPVWTGSKITFQLGANARTGTITVVTSEGTSNAIPFTVRSGKIFFVKTTGNDANTGTWEQPWRTMIKAKNTIAAGDIAYICDGVSQTSTDAYNAAINCGSPGTAAMPKALVAYPGARVTVGSTNIGRGFHFYSSGGGGKYWVISQLNITAGNLASGIVEGIRLVGNSITTPNGSGATAALEGYGNNAKILGNDIHHCGASNASKLYHNVYINNHSGGTISNVEIGWNTIRDSTANRGIQVFSDGTGMGPLSDFSIHDNVLSNLKGNGININSQTTGTFKVYNNVLNKVGKGPNFPEGSGSYAGILIDNNNTTLYLYHNVINDCGSSYGSAGLVSVGSGFTGTLYARNNIFFSNGQSYENYWVGKQPSAGANYNLFYGKGAAPSWDTQAKVADPLFVNVAGGDFHLKAGSPAYDSGTNVTASITPTCLDGCARPVGAGFDRGAYEYMSVGGNPPPPPPTGDTTPPTAITDLAAAAGPNSGEIVLSWKAPGDDGATGTAATYTIKQSLVEITTDALFNAGINVAGAPAPAVAGTIQSMTVKGLSPGQTYHFAVKTQDEVPNTSSLSNCAHNAITATPLPDPVPTEGAYQQSSGADGLVSVEAEHFSSQVKQGGHEWSVASLSGYSGESALKALPDSGASTDTGYTINSPRLDFKVNFVKTGTHYIWVRGVKMSQDNDSCHAGLDGQALSASDRISSFPTGSWGWSKSTMDGVPASFDVTTTGEHTVNIWMREDGFLLDKIIVTTNPNYSPTGAGPVESAKAGTPFQQDGGADGVVSIEGEHVDNQVKQGGHEWSPVTSQTGYSGENALKALPDSGASADTGYTTSSPRLDYKVNFVKTGTHYIWVRGIKISQDMDSCHAGIDGQASSTSDRISSFATGSWSWSKSTMDGIPASFDVPTTGVHTVNIWMREDGFLLDKIIVTSNPNYTPTGAGPAESARAASSNLLAPATQPALPQIITAKDGGTAIDQQSGLRLNIPPDTLPKDGYFEVNVLDQTILPALPEPLFWLSNKTYQIIFHDTQGTIIDQELPQAITITIPQVGQSTGQAVSGDGTVGEHLRVYKVNAAESKASEQSKEEAMVLLPTLTYNAGAQDVSVEITRFGIYSLAAAPAVASLEDLSCYPSPFDPNRQKLTIQYTLANESKVTVLVYDLLGNLVKTWEIPSGDTHGRQGLNQFTWDGRNGEGDTIANGGYIVFLQADGQKKKFKVLVVK